jgi:hypothetical protein
LAAFTSLLAGQRLVSAAEFEFRARFDWRSDGEIYQVWFHREFDGRLVQTMPIELEGDPVLQDLLAGVSVECTAKTQIGLPDWSVTTGACVLSRDIGEVVIEVIDCRGTQKRCEGEWRIVSGTGAFSSLTGSGSLVGNLVDPDPLPWFWNGPTLGYNELRGTIIIP